MTKTADYFTDSATRACFGFDADDVPHGSLLPGKNRRSLPQNLPD